MRRKALTPQEAAQLWQLPGLRSYLMRRDVGMVYRALAAQGVSQRLIAYYTGQSQSEVSEILHGRQVTSYDVLVRICLGLHIPPGHMGLAYDDDTARALGRTHPQVVAQRHAPTPPLPEPVQRPTPRPDPVAVWDWACGGTRLGEEGPPWQRVAGLQVHAGVARIRTHVRDQ